jgi:cytochrome c-type biogenesis protein CcmH/NrfG
MGVRSSKGAASDRDVQGLVTRGKLLLFTCGALVVGFVAGAIFGGIWEHRLASRVGGQPQGMVSSSPAVVSPEQRGELKALEARVARDPQDLEAWIGLGNLNYDMGRPAEAIRAYEKALALKPDNPDVMTDMGTMYRLLGQPQRAVELFREAHRVDPNHFNSLYNEGVVLLHDLNDMAGAARAWEEFLKLVPQGEQSERIRKILQNLKSQGKIP